MIEFVFAASPETNRRSLGSGLRRSVGNRQDLAACALCNSVVFLPQAGDLGAALL